MSVHLVNPSDNSFGTAVITPRWLFVLAAATPQTAGDPILIDESLEQIVPESILPGDIVGISVHTGNALRGYQVGRMARSRGAWVVYGGIHATLFPDEAFERGEAHAVVTGDGDVAWGKAVNDCLAGKPERVYTGGRLEGSEFLPARWDLMDPQKYMWASVQTIRGCPKHCSFCSVWRTDGQKPRQRNHQRVVDEIIELRRIGFRFIALADDNFYPVTLTDLRLAREQKNQAKLEELNAIRAERFQLMEELAKLPKDMVFFTQITMEAGEDGTYLDAMHKANIKGALVGVEAVTPEGLKAVFKDWNYSGEALARQLQTFKQHGVHVLGSFIFGLPTDKPATFDATVEMALKAGVTFAQFVMMTPFPGTVDFGKWEKEQAKDPMMVGDVPITRYWLIPTEVRPKMFTPASLHELRRNSRAHTKGMGQVLHLGSHLGKVCLHANTARPSRIHLSVEALPADVRGHRHLDRQRASQKVEEVGALDGTPMQEALPRHPHARTRGAGVGPRDSEARRGGGGGREDVGAICGDRRAVSGAGKCWTEPCPGRKLSSGK